MPRAFLPRPLRAAPFLAVLCVASPVESRADEASVTASDRVDYHRDIRPLLSDRCYACHGPDAGTRKASLRLDRRDVALENAIVPGDAAASELVRRVGSSDPDVRMPPVESKKAPLSPGEIELLRRWIDEGAEYEEHWAYVAPRRPEMPPVEDSRWGRQPIDRLLLSSLREKGLEPSPRADRRTLIRRLHLDLIGLPPSPQAVEEFVADERPDAYERRVDELLASKHYGERLAMYWLDVARYADSVGIHGDQENSASPYRDYVIRAFNDNISYDRFITEQLAGDLLPEATVEQKVASGYNRLHMITAEGGAQAKEYLAKYAADRVRNTSLAFFGATMGCAECHDHKFDPYTMEDFYSFAAFFADLKEAGVYGGSNWFPKMPVPRPSQEERLREAEKKLAELEAKLQRAAAGLEDPELVDGAEKKMPDAVREALAVDEGARSDEQHSAILDFFRQHAKELEASRRAVEAARKAKEQIENEIPTVLVSVAVEPRKMRVLPRGNWLDDSGKVVEPRVPSFLQLESVEGRRATRRDLARWMTDPRNPLVSRVFVNRIWALLFGEGIVPSLDDFGAQGQAPSHPRLLDWLAVEFVERGWDVKRLIKTIVLSEAYRQSSRVTDALRARDPQNRLFARQGRFRLDAELIRDNALAISGLLVRRIGGPSVKPYQPAGYWSHLNFPRRRYQADRGADLYRRGLYTHWQRTFLHPSLLAFDAPTREECTVDRPISNTPLQALVLLNDPTYVEAARVFAEKIVRSSGTTRERLVFAFREALARQPKQVEVEILERLLDSRREHYRAGPQAARELLGVGARPADAELDPVELATWTAVARAILNLHETITRY